MLKLATRHLEVVLRHSQACYPDEGCGLLIGKLDGETKLVQRVDAAPNERVDGAARRYLISSDAIRRAEKDAQSQGLEIVGFFHSHPDVAAIPSEYDRNHAWPWYSYLIVSVRNGDCREQRCWTLRDDRSGFDPEDLEIV